MRYLSSIAAVCVTATLLWGCNQPETGNATVAEGGGVPYVTSANFDQEVYDSDVPVLVDFTATWCGPCKIVDPIVESLQADVAGRAKIVKVDIDETPDVYQNLRVNGVPTVIFFNNGEEEDRISSPQSRETYLRYLEAMIEGQAAGSVSVTLLEDDSFRRHFILTRATADVEGTLEEYPDLLTAPFENGQTPLSLILNRPSVRQNALIELALARSTGVQPHEYVGLGWCERLALALEDDPELASRPDADGATPLYVALSRAHRLDDGGCLTMLLEAGADPSVPHNGEYLVSRSVLLKKDPALLAELLDRGLDPSATDNLGHNALHLAAVYGLVDSARLLLEHGVDVSAKTDQGQTARDILEERRDGSVTRLQESEDADSQDYYAERIRDYEALIALLQRARS